MLNLRTLLAGVHGGTFLGIDTEITVPLCRTIGRKRGTPPNPHYNRVTKRHTGAQVMCFQNKTTNAYANMVERRLIAEGKNPSRFELKPRVWGERIPDLPIVQHIPKNAVNPKFYLEVIFLRAGTSEFFLDGNPIDKDQIIGMPLDSPHNDEYQGGLDDEVIIRTYDVDSLVALRVDKMVHQAPFYFA